MRRQLLISVLIFSTFMVSNGQWSGTNPIWTYSNVGIGTTSPKGILGLGVNQGSMVSNQGLTLGSDQPIEFLGSAWGSGYGNKIYAADTGDGTGTDLRFASRSNTTSWTDRITIKGTGNTGFGTNSPLEKIHINGNLFLDIGYSLKFAHPFYPESWAGVNGVIDNTNGGGVNCTALIFNTGYGSSSEKMRITNSGNIGIGTSAPLHKLAVQGGMFRVNSNAGGDGNSGIRIGADNTTSQINWQIASNWNVGNAFEISPSTAGGGTTFSTPAITILYDGNTGIGTTAPSAKLEVNGAVIINGDTGDLAIHGTHSGVQNYVVRNYIGGVTYSGFEIYDQTNSSSRLTIAGGGNIGVGTTNPGNYKLNVSGTIRANEVVVNTSGADFVFAPDYKLRSLPEVERFIKENNHLPDLQSASEMTEKGMNVSEMQTKLLQKIEEQTLYIIELNKQLQDLKNQIEVIRK